MGSQSPHILPTEIPMSVYKSGKRWRAQPEYCGIRAQSKLFDLKADAVAYRDKAMSELRHAHKSGAINRHTLLEAINRFKLEITPKHKGGRWERIRLDALVKDVRLPIGKDLESIQPSDLKTWVADRGREVAPATVRREIGLLSSVFTAARLDWGWLKSNPFAEVRKPAKPKHRDRVITPYEIRAMLRALGYVTGATPRSMHQAVAYAFLIELRTGMRSGEIVGMQWGQVRDSWVELPVTKNGQARDVPLSKQAQRLFNCLRNLDKPIQVTSSQRDSLFRQARIRAKLGHFTFHDGRHTAATRIGKTVGQKGRLSFPEFCKVFGWIDPKMALVYVNPSAASLALKM